MNITGRAAEKPEFFNGIFTVGLRRAEPGMRTYASRERKLGRTEPPFPQKYRWTRTFLPHSTRPAGFEQAGECQGDQADRRGLGYDHGQDDVVAPTAQVADLVEVRAGAEGGALGEPEEVPDDGTLALVVEDGEHRARRG